MFVASKEVKGTIGLFLKRSNTTEERRRRMGEGGKAKLGKWEEMRGREGKYKQLSTRKQ